MSKDSRSQDDGLVRIVEREDTGDRVLLYATERGVKVELRYQGDTFWASQAQMADMFGVTSQNVTIHLRNIFEHGELAEAAVCKESLHTGRDGKRYPTKLYDLNEIISVGYRVGSKQGTMFRIWATDKLFQILTKGFYIDKERLKDQSDHDRIRELRETIRDIRASEANTYAELKRICAMCQDYDGTTEAAQRFYAHMQAKIFYAVTSYTPAEIQVARIRADAPNLGFRPGPRMTSGSRTHSLRRMSLRKRANRTEPRHGHSPGYLRRSARYRKADQDG